jgi:hypothetical protein
MSVLKLMRADPQNGLFDKLKKQWDSEIKAQSEDESAAGYYEPMMDHAAGIAAENAQDPNYGIFVLVRHDKSGKAVSYDGMVHINFAKFHPKGKTLRMVWNLIAPRFEFEDNKIEIAQVQAAFLLQGLELREGFKGCERMQIYLGNAIDREFMAVAVAFLDKSGHNPSFQIGGNWLHVTEKARKLRAVK